MEDVSFNDHEGHRSRLLENYCQTGLDGFSDVQALEMLLSFAIPRKDTNALAHQLLRQFGRLNDVLEAPIDWLTQVPGMTRRAAVLVHLQLRLWMRYDIVRQRSVKILPTTEACGKYLLPFFRDAREEQAWLLCLDGKCKVLTCRQIGRGSLNSANVPIRRVVETVLAFNATAAVMAHNHTSGIALPSQADIEATTRIREALSCVDVYLVDHVVVADDDFVSMRASNLM